MAVAFIPPSLRHQWVSCSNFMKSSKAAHFTSYPNQDVKVRTLNRSLCLRPHTEKGTSIPMYTVRLRSAMCDNPYIPACRHEVLREKIRETAIGLTPESIEHLFVAHILSKYGETQAKFAAMFVENLKSSNEGCPESQGLEKNK